MFSERLKVVWKLILLYFGRVKLVKFVSESSGLVLIINDEEIYFKVEIENCIMIK